MAGEYVFNLEGINKQHGVDIVLEEVNLAFFFGAKIGVIGPNGSGKSSLLKIMAGDDTDYTGRVHVAPRARIGYLAQEPAIDPTKTVAEVVAEGVVEQQRKLDRYDELCDMLAEDLSEGGLRASATDFVPMGSRLLVTLDREEPKQAIRAVGTVVWVRQLGTLERWSLGLSFDDLSPATQAQVRELLQGPIP